MAVVLPANIDVPAATAVPGYLLKGKFSPARGTKKGPPFLKVAQLCLDLATVCVAMVAAFLLKGFLPGGDPAADTSRHLLLGLLSLPMWTLMFWRGRLYSGPHIAGRLDEFRRLIQAELRTFGVLVITAFLLRMYVSRGWLLLSALLAIVMLATQRGLVRRTVGKLRRAGRLQTRVILVGGNVEALGLCAMLADDPSLGYTPIGFVDDEAYTGSRLLGGFPVLGGVAETYQIALRAGASAVIIATTAVDHETTNRLIRQLASSGIQVELSSSLRDIAPTRLMLRPLGRFPVMYVDPVNRDGWEMRAKRTFDVVTAALVGVFATPILLVAAAAIKLTSRGPVHFRQERVGKDGEPFEVLKLRTMVVNAEELMESLRCQNQANGPLFKMRSDPRITRVGRLLRALSIDELPQVWNVLRGHMSLVGPRPALPREVHMWSPELHGRLTVKPGMTGMWQVSGGRRWASFDEYSRLDLYYVDNWSIWTDLAILVKTVPAVLFGRSQA